jgi:limonene-1,2-epoxide hydrolase
MQTMVTGEARGAHSHVAYRLFAADTLNMTNQEGFKDIGRKIEEKFNQSMPRVEEEVRRVIAYLNDEVMPEVQQNSSKALRSAAEQLTKLAERLDRNAGGH